MDVTGPFVPCQQENAEYVPKASRLRRHGLAMMRMADAPQLPRTSTNPSGGRALTPALSRNERAARAFNGLPSDQTRRDVLFTIEECGPYAGWKQHDIAFFQLLMDRSNDLDWLPGRHPIVWVAGETLRQELGLKASSSVRRRQARLIDLGAISFKDSSNCGRKGRRGPDRHIQDDDTYGIDLSPAACLLDALPAIRQRAIAERRQKRTLKHQIAAASRHARAALAALAGTASPADDEVQVLQHELEELSPPLPRNPDLEDLRHRRDALQRIDDRLTDILAGPSAPLSPDDPSAGSDDAVRPKTRAQASDSARRGVRKCAPVPNTRTSEPRVYDRTAVPAGARQKEAVEPGSAPARAVPADRPFPTWPRELDPRHVAAAAPRTMQAWLPRDAEASWNDLIDAAANSYPTFRIGRQAWIDACRGMGREQAATSVVIIAARIERGDRPIDRPSGYLNGMTRKAAGGELHLGPTIMGLLRTKPAHLN
ncbi:MAG: plasmid replication protein RepC [Rhodospirillaceae bacterium]|nr:plasmid replication protein RepC [Rhodospirillaceae bacterium]